MRKIFLDKKSKVNLLEDMDVKSKNAAEQRRANAHLVLNIIRKHDGISRQDIATQTGLSKPSVTKIVEYLSELKLLTSDIQKGRNNKRIPFYRFRGDMYAVLGLEFGRTKIVGVGCDLTGKVFGKFSVEDLEGPYHEIVDRTARHLQTLQHQAAQLGRPVFGLGIGAPGPIDPKERKLLYPYGFHQWKNLALGKDFEERLHLSVFLEKDTDVSALAEKFVGAGRQKHDLLYVEIGEGIGSAVIHQDRIFRGNSRVYCSLGHTTVSLGGPRCECGNYGCLELYTKESVVVHKIQQAESAQEQDAVFKETADYLAAGISNLILLMGIETVIIGGELIVRYERLFHYLQELIPKRTFPSLQRKIEIQKCQLMNDSVALGSALWVAESALLNLNTLKYYQQGQLAKLMPHEIAT